MKSFLMGFGAGAIPTAIIVAVIFLIVPGFTSQPLTVDELLELGDKYLLEMDYEQARVAFQSVIDVEPQNLRALIGLGKSYIGLESYPDAESVLFDVFDIDSENREAYDELISLAEIHTDAGRYTDAHSLYIRLLEKFERDRNICIALQELFDMMQDYEKLADIIGQLRDMGLFDYIVYGEIVGRVIDGTTEMYDIVPLVNSVISLQRDNAAGRVLNTDSDGVYTGYVRSGNLLQTVSAAGYIPFVQRLEIPANDIIYLATIELVPESDGSGLISGRIIDALSGYGVPYAVIDVFDRDMNKIDTIYADDAGYYEYTNIAGYYFFQANLAGYSTSERYSAVIGYTDVYNRDLTMTPRLNEGEVRIVLTWGLYPQDLDSHLIGPNDSGGKFHIYYSDMSYYEEILVAFLDLDDTDSYGPETTTMYRMREGHTYSFIVHDFTNKGNSYSTALADSGANVKVFIGDDVREFNVPPGIVGDRWHVFDIVNGVVTAPTSTEWESYFGW